MPDSFKFRLKSLSVNKKLVLIGGIIALIGVFLPWYKDIDQFQTGDMFLGITGPLYLVGIIVLAAALTPVVLIALQLNEKPLPKLPMSENYLYIFSSSLAFLMLVLALSVYFHPKFGINLTDKNIQIGMLLDFVGNGLVLLGGVLLLKHKEIDFDGGAVVKPLIDMKEFAPLSRAHGNGLGNPSGALENRTAGEFRAKNPNESAVRDIIQESLDDLTKPPSGNINNY